MHILSPEIHMVIKKETRGPWAIIHSPDKNSYCISAKAMQLLPVLPQQLGLTDGWKNDVALAHPYDVGSHVTSLVKF